MIKSQEKSGKGAKTAKKYVYNNQLQFLLPICQLKHTEDSGNIQREENKSHHDPVQDDVEQERLAAQVSEGEATHSHSNLKRIHHQIAICLFSIVYSHL